METSLVTKCEVGISVADAENKCFRQMKLKKWIYWAVFLNWADYCCPFINIEINKLLGFWTLISLTFSIFQFIKKSIINFIRFKYYDYSILSYVF